MPIIVKPKQIRARQTVKPTTKAEGKITSLPNVKDPEVLITQLIQLFNKDWKKEKRIFAFLTSINWADTTLDQLYILATFLYKANSIDSGDFVFLI